MTNVNDLLGKLTTACEAWHSGLPANDVVRLCENDIPHLIADLEDEARKFDECVGGFKRDLQHKLDDQRAKNERLKKRLAASEAALEASKQEWYEQGKVDGWEACETCHGIDN